MTTYIWVLIGVLAYPVVALGVGVLIGKIIARRDEQVPGDEAS